MIVPGPTISKPPLDMSMDTEKAEAGVNIRHKMRIDAATFFFMGSLPDRSDCLKITPEVLIRMPAFEPNTGNPLNHQIIWEPSQTFECEKNFIINHRS
jgi:hypothetical protein